MVQRANLVAVIHDFSQSHGSFYGEAKYNVESTGDVSMTVNGSSISYHHSALGWMRQASCWWDDNLKIGMSWYYVKTVGSSIIYRFMRLDNKVMSDPVSPAAALTKVGMYSDEGIDVSSVRSVGKVVDLDLRVLPWGSVVVVRKGPRHYSVPKHVVAQARLACALMPRTAEVFQSTVRKVKEYLKRDGTVDICDAPEVLILSSTIGFVADMIDEITLLVELEKKMRNVSAIHDDALNFRQVKVSGFWSFIYRMWSKPPELALQTYESSLLAIQNRDHSSMAGGGALGFVTLPGVNSINKVMSVPKKAKFRYSYNWGKTRTKGAQLCGIGVACKIPVVSCDSPGNEEIAIINRVLNSPPDPEAGLWTRIGVKLCTEMIPRGIIKAMHFEAWNNSFPLARRDKQSRAYQDYKNCPDKSVIIKNCVRKAFIKREKLLKSGVEGMEDFDPRVIQGCGDLANCLLGPWMRSFGKYLAKHWNFDSSSNYTYASGCSAEQIGKWVDDSVAQGYNSFWLNDYSRLDASLATEALQAEQTVYYMCGAGPDQQAVLTEQLHIHGYSKHGFYYSVCKGRCSGDPNTSCGNTMLVVGANDYVYGVVVLTMRVQEEKTGKRILGLGDDSVLAAKFDPDIGLLESVPARLGLKAKPKVINDPDLIEFCSGYVWNTDFGRVWGPKPGRFLAKIAYSTSQQLDPTGWLKGVLTCVKDDVAFIPILATYVSHCLKLLAKANGARTEQPHKYHVSKVHKATADTYAQFYKLYDSNLVELDSLKTYILSINRLPYLMDHPLLTKMVAVDC